MKKLSIILASMVLVISGCGGDGVEAPSALEVKKSMQINAGLDAVWAYAGDFCAISVWHPVVENCEIVEENGATYRMLTLGDGAELKERHDGDTENGYSYTIVGGPLPLKDYSSTFQAEGDATSATINWSSTFMAAGIPDDEAIGIVTGIYEGGLSSIAGNFSE